MNLACVTDILEGPYNANHKRVSIHIVPTSAVDIVLSGTGYLQDLCLWSLIASSRHLNDPVRLCSTRHLHPHFTP